MSTELVQYVEDFCDLMETLPTFTLFGKQLSKPASTAAARAFYYVEKKTDGILMNEKFLIYETMRYVMSNEQCKWGTLKVEEKIALLNRLDAFKVLVFY